MPYDEELAERVRAVLDDRPTEEKRMFGGLAFLVGGHMAVAAAGRGSLMVRVDPADAERLLDEPGAGPMEMSGRAVKGWLLIGDDGLRDDAALEAWVARGVRYVESLPPKR